MQHARRFLLIGCLLGFGIALPVYQYIHSARSILHRTHDVYKTVVHADVQWVETRTIRPNRNANGQYELWRVSQGAVPLLVEAFRLGPFTDLTWSVNTHDDMNVSYRSGGPEGGRMEHVVYDRKGDEQMRVVQDFPHATRFTFQTSQSPLYTVTYLLDPVCTGSVHDGGIPQAHIQGIMISRGPVKHSISEKYFLPEILTVPCVAVHEDLVDPSLEVVDVDETTVLIRLPHGVTATVTYESLEKQTVIFQVPDSAKL